MFPPTLVLRPLFSLIVVAVLLLAMSAGVRAQSFSTSTDYALGDNPNSGIAADFKGDGKLDLAIGNVLNKNVSILINNGNGTFAGAVNYTVDFNPETSTAADFNGDGTLQAAVPINVGIQPQGVVAGDLNGDGRPDLAVADTLLNLFNFGGSDQRRRISLFVWHLQLLPTDTAANLTVTADDGVGGVYTLPVEHISQFTAIPDVTQIIVRLPDMVVGAPRDLSLKVQLRGPASNSAIIKIAAP